MRTSERLTIGSNRSLCSLGRAKARPLTKTLANRILLNGFLHRVHPQYRSTALGFTQFRNLCLLNHRFHHRGTSKLRFASNIETLDLSRFARYFAQRVTSRNVVLQFMRTSERLTIGSNRSLRSLGRAKARPLTKR